MPRLLFLTTEYWSFESHKLGMAAAARDAGFDAAVAARGVPAQPPAGFSVIEFPWRRAGTTLGAALRFLPDVARVRRLLRDHPPAALHAIDLRPGIVGAVAAFGSGIPVLISINGLGFTFFARTLPARLIQWACGVILRLAVRTNRGQILVQNRDDAAVVEGALGVDPARVRLIRGSGVDPALFTPQPIAHQPIGKGHRFRFLILSRLLYMKGIQVAVEAHEILRTRGVESTLVIGGVPDSGNPSSIPQSVLDRWAKIPGVELPGHVKDVRSVLAETDVVLHPALGGEGLPKALLEAAAAGRAMIATDVPGNREVVVPGETGLLVPPGDAVALADAMQRAIDAPSDCAQWGAAARDKVVREFSASLIRDQHAALYRDLAAHS